VRGLPASVTVSGAGGTAFVVTLSNTSSVMVAPFDPASVIRRFPFAFGLPVLALALALSLWRATANKHPLEHVAVPVGLVLCLATCVLIGASRGGSAPRTNATLTIRGTSTGVSRSLPVDITVSH